MIRPHTRFHRQRPNNLRALAVPLTACSLLALSSTVAAAVTVRTQPNGNTVATTYVLVGESRTYFGQAVDAGSGTLSCAWTIDGIAGVPSTPADPTYISATASFATSGTKTLILKCDVKDGDTVLESDTSTIEVLALAADNDLRKKNSAIDKALRYSYQQQNKANGCFNSWGYEVPYTGMAVLAMENHGHNLAPLTPENMVAQRKDIYRWSVEKGLQCLYDNSVTVDLSAQPCIGDPESDDADNPPEADGKGIRFGDGNQYYGPFAVLAIVNATDKVTAASIKPTTATGSDLINGTNSLLDIIRDARDYFAWSMTDLDPPSCPMNGWRYSENDYSIDNSVSQWPPLALYEAFYRWGIDSKPAVKTQLEGWLDYSQTLTGDLAGSYGYDSPGYWNNTAKTGAGLIMRHFTGHPLADPKNDLSVQFIGNDWYNPGNYWTGNMSNLYAMYAVFKAFKLYGKATLEVPAGSGNHLSWEKGYSDWLVANQQANGTWTTDPWMDSIMQTYFGVAMLAPEVAGLPPVAVAGGPYNPVNPNSRFLLDGSHSYHQDPARQIITYQWDFDSSNGLWWTTKAAPDANEGAFGQTATNPGYAAIGTYTNTLRVLDNSTPQQSDTDTAPVTVTNANVPPVARTNGPWAGIPSLNAICDPTNSAAVNNPLCYPLNFDGSASTDADGTITGYEWDLNGNGVFNEGNGVDGWPQGAMGTPDYWKVVKKLYQTPTSGTATLRVTDNNGLTNTASEKIVSIAFVYANVYSYCYKVATNRFTQQQGVAVTFKNIGTGTAENVQMQLTNAPANVVIVKGSTSLGDLAGGTSKTSPCGGTLATSDIVWNVISGGQGTGGWSWTTRFRFNGVDYVIPNLPAVAPGS
jgi:hypothetical protein